MQVELTPDEAQQIVTLMDVACKAGGMQAALIAVPLFRKLEATAIEAENPPATAKESATLEAELAETLADAADQPAEPAATP